METFLPQISQKKDTKEKKVVTTKDYLKSLKTFQPQNIIQNQKLKQGVSMANLSFKSRSIVLAASFTHAAYKTQRRARSSSKITQVPRPGNAR